MTDENALSPDPERVIARLHPSQPRRAFGALVLASLGCLLLYLALWTPPAELGWQVFLLALGAGALLMTVQLWQATAVAIELTGVELRESTGRRIALVQDVRFVGRGALAFKPSNGFSLSLATPASRVWAPGLWWRLGRRVGIGGVTAGHEAKFMAEAIEAMIARPDL